MRNPLAQREGIRGLVPRPDLTGTRVSYFKLELRMDRR